MKIIINNNKYDFIPQNIIKYKNKIFYNGMKINRDSQVIFECEICGAIISMRLNSIRKKNYKTICSSCSAKKTSLNNWGVEYPSQNKEVQAQQRKTIENKYGVSYPLQCESIHDKFKNTMQNMYGVTHPSLSKELINRRTKIFMEHNNVDCYTQFEKSKAKYKKSMMNKYGVENPSYNKNSIIKRKQTRLESMYYSFYGSRLDGLVIPDFSVEEYSGCDSWTYKYPWICVKCGEHFLDTVKDGNIPKCPVCFPKYRSAEEIELGDFIKSLGPKIIENTRNVIHPMELDIYLPEYKLAIEYNGLYWHSELHGKNTNYHLNKYNLCKDKGIELLFIFSDEWNNDKNIIKNFIRKKILGKSIDYIPKIKLHGNMIIANKELLSADIDFLKYENNTLLVEKGNGIFPFNVIKELPPKASWTNYKIRKHSKVGMTDKIWNAGYILYQLGHS